MPNGPRRRIRTAERVESRLIDLGVLIGSPRLSYFRHPRQDEVPEWMGPRLRVTSDLGWNSQEWQDEGDVWIRTRHARALTWLLFEIRDAFDSWLDYSTKEPFFSHLARAARRRLSASQPEPDDPRPLLKDVLSAAFEAQQRVQRYDALPSASLAAEPPCGI